MNHFIKRLTEKASDLGALAQSITESGVRSVSEFIGKTRFFRSLSATTTEEVASDETHYFLVPLLGAQRQYAIYTKRILPPDTGAMNSLPKSRIFHVPDETGRSLIEQKLLDDIVIEGLEPEHRASPLADTLEKLADTIDKESDKLSGGLLLIGGAVAVVNPVLGIGIAVKALLPSIGAKVTKASAEYVGNKLRDWNGSSAESKLRKNAAEEVKKLKPIIYPNSILRSIDAIASNPQTDFDPAFDERTWADQFDPAHYYAATAEAIREVYKDLFKSFDPEGYQAIHIRWIKTFCQ